MENGLRPQSFIAFFEKIKALEKLKPGLISRVFEDHPPTPDRIARAQQEIARILPPRDQYLVETWEFQEIKARLARIENKRKLKDNENGNRPQLRRAGASDPQQKNDPASDSRPTLTTREGN